MPKIAYISKTFNPTAEQMIQRVNTIVNDYRKQGLVLTLRQVYYQFVSRDWLPDTWKDPATGSTNNERSYKKLGDIISDGRMSGRIDWEAIEDRTRFIRANNHWDSHADIVDACAKQFQIDKWADQPYAVEIWVEKDALVGVVEQIARQHDVAFFSCRGYTSQTALWDAAMRMKSYIKAGRTPLILHFGDHDPSGRDMTRDIRDRLEMFAGEPVEVRRMALNMDQIERYSPPPNPTKVTDSRSGAYIEEFGTECWELDALEPRVLIDLIEQEIISVRDEKKWIAKREAEREHRACLSAVAEQWDEVADRYGE